MTNDGELQRLKELQDIAFHNKNLAWTCLQAIELRNQGQITKLKDDHDELSRTMWLLLQRSAYAFRLREHIKAKSYSAKASRLKQRIARIDSQAQRLIEENKQAAHRFFQRRDALDIANSAYARVWMRLNAGRADIPAEYHDALRITTHADGSTGIYFGGIGSPAGPEHGHYVVNELGELTYLRPPSAAHGSHNFVRRPQAAVAPVQVTPGLA